MKKSLLLLLALPLLAYSQTSANDEQLTEEKLELIETIYYDRDQYIASDEERERLHDLIDEMRADSTINISVIGYADKWGGDQVNNHFSLTRAMYIADWIRSCRVPKSQISYVGEGIDTEAPSDQEARRVEISQVIKIVIEPEPTPEPTPKPEPTPETPEVPAEVPADPEPVPADPAPETILPAETPRQKIDLGEITLRTNLLYWLTGMMNVGAELRLTNSPLGVVLNGGYSPFGGKNGAHALGGWYVSPELRYYIPSHEEWFVGVQALAQGYNYKLGDTGYQGSLYGGGVMGGYKLPLTDRFDMDFTLGVGYGKFEYDRYYHSNGVNVIIESGKTKSGVTPIQAGVNLIWKIK